ncbi:MAG TPA: hypothetical protein VI300_13525 [Solirubrobacter sp.]
MSFEWEGGVSLADWADGIESGVSTLGHRLAEDALERYRHNVELNTPVNTGVLRSSYRLTTVHYGPVEGSRLLEMAWTGSVYTEVGYAEFVERGTGLYGPEHAMYEIKPKNPGGLLHWVTPAGGHAFAKRVMHPGSPGVAMFRIGVVLTEAEADEWSYAALREWERTSMDVAELKTRTRVSWKDGFN